MKGLKRILAASVACVIAFSTMLTTVNGADAQGTVNASLLNLRAQASTASAVLTQIPNGTSVTVFETANGWAKVTYNGLTGYVSLDYLVLRQGCTTSALNLRAEANTSSAILTQMPLGTVLSVQSVSSGWARVTYSGVTGYASLDYIQFGQAEAAPAMPNRSGAVSSKGQAVAELAKQHLGKPYVYGAAGPNNFDCSGFVYYVYKQFGVSLNRVAHDQMKNGTYVPADQLQPGDIVGFSRGDGYIHHVGIYVGNGMMIHSPQTGDVVKYESVVTGNYANRLVGGRRIF